MDKSMSYNMVIEALLIYVCPINEMTLWIFSLSYFRGSKEVYTHPESQMYIDWENAETMF